jgi:hypothetical protein
MEAIHVIFGLCHNITHTELSWSKYQQDPLIALKVVQPSLLDVHTDSHTTSFHERMVQFLKIPFPSQMERVKQM